MTWEPVIGLEIHVQLATRSKIFSGAATAFGAEPNRQACAVDLGLPGVLPVLNASAVEMAVALGLAIGGTIAPSSVFARKNYFYPDLPKGYQISQYDTPIVSGGSITIDGADGSARTIRIARAHLEEDAGKSLHDELRDATGIDLNRAGTPLLEIVSYPELHAAAEAAAYMREMHRLVRRLGICDGNMQEGSMRCDANVSVRRRGTSTLGTRTEIKNLNSFRFIERAIEYEIERHIDVLEYAGTIRQETRLYDPEADETRPLRSKEDAHDYRYFPDPDLLPVSVSTEMIERIRATLPELPRASEERYVRALKLSAADARTLANEPAAMDYFDAAAAAARAPAVNIAHWVTGTVFAALAQDNRAWADCAVSPQRLAELVDRVIDGSISNAQGKQVFRLMWDSGDDAARIIAAQGFEQVSDTAFIDAAVAKVIADHPTQVGDYRAGKTKILSFLVGQVLKATRGKANPELVKDALARVLDAP